MTSCFVSVILPSMRLATPFTPTLSALHPGATIEYFKLVPVTDEQIPGLIDEGVNIAYKASSLDSRAGSAQAST